MTAEHREAHRTSFAGPAQAARLLEDADPHTSVIFVNVAQSGATIPLGLLFNMEGGETKGFPLPPQLDQLEQMLQGRRIDALLLSVGINDIGLNGIMSEVALNLLPFAGLGHPDNDQDLIDLAQVVSSRLTFLGQRYDQLDTEIRSRLDVDNIFLTQYPDPTVAADGSPRRSRRLMLTVEVSVKEADWHANTSSRRWTPRCRRQPRTTGPTSRAPSTPSAVMAMPPLSGRLISTYERPGNRGRPTAHRRHLEPLPGTMHPNVRANRPWAT
jgi:hypothetical protein